MYPRARDLCLATVTDDDYLPGTTVLLSSFLRHNPWFDGEIVVIHDGLSNAARQQLRAFPRVRFHAVSRILEERLSDLAAHHPRLAPNLPRFFSLEAFTQGDYDTVLFLDSDVLCRGDAMGILEFEGAVLGCPDLSSLAGLVRDRRTFRAHGPAVLPPAADILGDSINAGVIVFRPGSLKPGLFGDLLERLRPELWDSISTGHTDQVVLNLEFEQRWTLLPEKYNYLIRPDSTALGRRRIPVNEAVFLHFVGRPKPWQPETLSERHGERALAFGFWRAARDEQHRQPINVPS